MMLIAVSPSGHTELDQSIRSDYLEALIRAGAMPVVMPLTENKEVIHAILDKADGVLMSGGVDVHPRYFGEEVLPCCGTISEKRDAVEEIMLRYAIEKDMPMLCICRGMQYLNIILGGTLYQDIPEQYSKELLHSRSDTPADPVHDAAITPGTLLHSIVDCDVLPINSRHHQAVKKLAPGAVLNAVAPDGTVEGFEVPSKRFMLATQWHPESLSDRYEKHQHIFNAFIKACESK
ncbi:MAG: gamma-glutamyl-gamma-aminobutyrate hydrolase family protein [Clostridiales bacterium]|nr:gamma-glutamyl-gamma-aminobutyrate hydrolase family protein [Clostridiales bacterium]